MNSSRPKEVGQEWGGPTLITSLSCSLRGPSHSQTNPSKQGQAPPYQLWGDHPTYLKAGLAASAHSPLRHPSLSQASRSRPKFNGIELESTNWRFQIDATLQDSPPPPIHCWPASSLVALLCPPVLYEKVVGLEGLPVSPPRPTVRRPCHVLDCITLLSTSFFLSNSWLSLCPCDPFPGPRALAPVAQILLSSCPQPTGVSLGSL